METLLITLERRLANVIFRLNWAPSMPAANQMVSHGLVLVNGKKINVAGYTIAKGDTLSLTERGFASLNYTQAQATPRLPSIPACFTIEGKIAKVVDMPLPSDIPFEYEGQLVTEYYWKVK
jgi:small subunit ribosomal protein S4